MGVARIVTIDSAQPKIDENTQELPVGFKIKESSLDDAPSEPTLLLDFGAMDPDTSRTGRWEMETGHWITIRFNNRSELLL